MEPIEQKEEQRKIKKRNPFIAFLFSFLLPGLGHIYIGQLKEGIIIFLLSVFEIFLFGFTRWVTHFSGLVFLVIISLLIYLYALIDATIVAIGKKNYMLKVYNKWYLYVIILLIPVIIPLKSIWISILGVQTFSMPILSSSPTIQRNDYLVADLKAYNKKPIEYGDIIVYKVSNNDMSVHRVIGLPKDEIEIIDSVISINGKVLKTILISTAIIDVFPVIEYEEELPNGKKHKMYRWNRKLFPPEYFFEIYNEKITLPSNCYYVLGDNRDLSYDSRKIGNILRDDILGKVVYSYWGESFDRIGIDFRDR